MQFQEVFTATLPFLFEKILLNQALITIPQHFLANATVSRTFSRYALSVKVYVYGFIKACIGGTVLV